MKPRATRGLTRARIVALVVIAAMAAGLVVLRVAPGEETVSVPAGAKAGDLTPLEPCEFATDEGPLPAECGTLVVPENRANPSSRLIALPVTRIPARSADPAEPIFFLEGGPGISNMVFPQARAFAERRDVVLVGFRGVDGSVRLDCPEVGSALARQADYFSEASYRSYGDAFRACADRLTEEGVDLAGYGIPQEMDDLEAARVALGYDRIDLLSQSAGTRRALVYSWNYPDSVHRSVLVGANPPGHFLWDPGIADEQIARWAALCAGDTECRRRTGDLAASMATTSADLPDRWGLLPVNEGNVRLYTFYGLMESTSKSAPMAATWTLDSWLAAADGDASGFWLLSFVGEVMAIPFAWGQYAGDASLDAQAAREYFAAGNHDRTNLGYVGSAFVWGGGLLAEGWPGAANAERYRRVPTSEVETLVINGELDFSTPPQVAKRELLPLLPNGQEVVLPRFGHTFTFFSEQRQAGAHLVNTYLDTGRIDTSRYVPQELDFTPAGSLPGLAKGLAVIFVGLVLGAALLLGWLAHRVRTRGGLGWAASVVVRSLGPVILGLGGCVVGVLTAYAFLPSVPLVSAPLVAISTGLPIGVGVYLAWTNRSHALVVRRAAIAAAVGGALIGAWLGLAATDDILSIFTAIIGAALGANLALLIVDIAQPSSGQAGGEAAPSTSVAIGTTRI